MSRGDDASVHAPDDHGSAHGHEVEGEPLGALDTGAWAAAILGGGVGVLVALALFVATQA